MATSKAERLKEFKKRVEQAPSCGSFDEGISLVTKMLNDVEDEMSDTPYDPAAWEHDGRMYPPQEDSIRLVEGHPEVKRLRSRFHNTFIRTNGGIKIEDLRNSQVILDKPGNDGRKAFDT
ncbi:MAG: hypothetical protein ACMG6S_17705 [Byssovorax sp.]